MTRIWSDDPAGLYTDVAVRNNASIGTLANPLGTVFAQTVQADNLVGDTTLAFDNYLSALGSTGQSLELVKGDATDNTVVNTPTSKVGKLAVNGVTIATWDVNSFDAPIFNLTDGADKNHSVTTYGSGTAYALTTTPAAIDMGTSDPTLVLDKAGTYLLFAQVNLQFAGATFASSRTVTLKLRRTNNTPADVTGSSTAMATGVTSTVTGTMANVWLPPVVYTTVNTNDIIVPFADVSTGPTAGALNATEAAIVAVRIR